MLAYHWNCMDRVKLSLWNIFTQRNIHPLYSDALCAIESVIKQKDKRLRKKYIKGFPSVQMFWPPCIPVFNNKIHHDYNSETVNRDYLILIALTPQLYTTAKSLDLSERSVFIWPWSCHCEAATSAPQTAFEVFYACLRAPSCLSA